MRKLSIGIKFALGVCGILAGLMWWSKLEHQPSGALAAVRDYIARESSIANMGDPKAAPSTPNPATEKIPPTRLAACKQPSAFEPFQTNGNRLRSLLQRRNPDQTVVSIDFSDCSVRFYLQRLANGSWQIRRVHSHAG